MKAKKFLVILTLLAVALFAVACNGGDDTTEGTTAPTTTTAAGTTTAATTTEATTTEQTTTAATTTTVTTKVTTTKVTTTVTTLAPEPEKPVVTEPVLWDGSVATEFAGGTGTASDPYQIATAAQLAYMAENFVKGAYYQLTMDIMINDVYNFEFWGSRPFVPMNTWTPIEGFNAHLDGNGKTIYGLYTTEGSGLFATTKDATIENLAIAYAKISGVEGAPVGILVGVATDTNLADITVDYESVYLNGEITNEESPVALEIVITLGSKPEVWSLENLAVGALADGFIAANDNYGTAFEVTIVDGKGFYEEEDEGKKALAWNSNSAEGQTLVINYTNDATAVANWKGATEVLVYIDGREQAGDYKFGISLVDMNGKTWSVKAGATVYTQDGSAWVEKVADGANLALADGYAGYVRIPTAAFTDGAEGTLDLLANGIAQLAFYYENAASAETEGLFYIDSVRITLPEGAVADTPISLPTLAPAYGATILQDFSGELTLKDKDSAKAEGSIVDGAYNVTFKSTGGADTYFPVGQNLASNLKGFMLYLDASKVTPTEEAGQNKKYPTNLHKDFQIGFRFIVDGQAYSAGGTGYADSSKYSNYLYQNTTYFQTEDGRWMARTNSNNNRICIPYLGYEGWVFVPVENLSANGHNAKFLADYLTEKNGEAVLTEMLLYYNEGLAGSVVTIDNLIAVTGNSVSPFEAPAEGMPAKLPTDVNYVINGDIDFENADIFFTIRNTGAVVADKGLNNSGAWAITSVADGGNVEASISTKQTYNLSTSKLDEGFMMYIDLSGVTAAEGKTDVQFGFGVATFYSDQLRADNESGYVNNGGNYFNFRFGDDKSGESSGLKTAFAYILDENGNWVTVTNGTQKQRIDIPAGYKGYLYIPYVSLNRNGSGGTSQNLFTHSSNGVGSQMPVIRQYYVQLQGTGAADQVAYVDDIQIVRATEKNLPSSAPADFLPALPDGKDYNVAYQFSFENADDFLVFKGNSTNYSFSTDRAVSGNALSFSALEGKSRGEMYVTLKKNYDMEGVKGVLFHIDFSNVTCQKNEDGSTKTAATITFNMNSYRSNGNKSSVYYNKGYYLVDGTTEWQETGSVSSGNDRMALPNGFVGWVYVPVSSYNGSAQLFNPLTGTIVPESDMIGFRIYTDGYDYTGNQFVTIDELTYVR